METTGPRNQQINIWIRLFAQYRYNIGPNNDIRYVKFCNTISQIETHF
jgi:hypothetical protein